MDDNDLGGELQGLTPIVPFSPLLSHLQRMQSLPRQALSAIPRLIDNGPLKLPSWITKDLIMGILSGKYEYFVSDDDSFLGKAERICMMRYVEGSVEFLVKSSCSVFCKWVHETEFMQYKVFSKLLEVFYLHPFDFDQLQVNGSIIVLTSREAKERTEYLFRIDNGQFVVFYWGAALNSLEMSSAGVYEAVKTRILRQKPPPVEDVVPFESRDLMPYQVEGVNWLLKIWKRGKSGCVLGDDIGMGKTIQFLSFWAHLREHTAWKGPCLVLVNDVRNLRSWTDHISVIGKSATIVYEGSRQECKVLREWALVSRDDEGNIQKDYLPFELVLMTYDRFSRDFEHLKSIPFQIVCCDNLIVVNVISRLVSISDIPFKVVLFDNGFDAGFERMQYILKFVQPDVDWKAMFDRRAKTVVLCRRRVDLAPKNTYRKDLVAFVAPTPWQSVFLRLINLHQLGEMLAADSEKSTWMSGDVMAKRICNHPYLINGLESFLDSKIRAEKKSKMIGCSSKFIFLDMVIPICLQQNKPVIIMTQIHDLIGLLDEFCASREYSKLVLTTETTTEERQRIMYQFNSESPPDVLMSTVPLYSYEVASGRIMFVLDADWHPEEYIMPLSSFFAPATDHEVITVIHVVNFGCYDHEEYIERQRNRFLWQESVSLCEMENTVLNVPPDILSITGGPKSDINEALQEVAQVVSAMDFPAIDQAIRDMTTPTRVDDRMLMEFVEHFGNLRRKPRKGGHYGHYRELSVAEFQLLAEMMIKYGYGAWTVISRRMGLSSSHISSYARALIVVVFRCLPFIDVPSYPILIQSLIDDIDNFSISGLFCCNKASITSLPEYPDLHDTVQKLKKHNHLLDRFDKYTFLSILEQRLIYRKWSKSFGRNNFLFSRLPPPKVHAVDRLAFDAFVDHLDMNIDDPRIKDIISIMKYDLISNGKVDGMSATFPWWSEAEIDAAIRTVIKYGFDYLSPEELHARSGILSKTKEEVVSFITGLKEVVSSGESCLVRLRHLDKAPDLIQESTDSWKGLTETQIADIKFHAQAMNNVHILLSTVSKLDTLELPVPWQKDDFCRLLRAIVRHGLPSFEAILDDPTTRLPSRSTPDGKLIPCFASIHDFAWYIDRLT